MVVITKDEAKYMRENLKDVLIVRTAKQRSKRHKYYMTEETKAMKILDAYRSRNGGAH